MTDSTDATEKTVVEMHDAGNTWSYIADAHDLDVEEAMARYREEAYDDWDTGWEREAEAGVGRVTTGAVDLWVDGDASVDIEEVRDTIPLTVVVDGGETRTLAMAELSVGQARDLVAALDECADILEEKQ